MNSMIEKARQKALDILKPSQKDMEHGLELHKNAIVFDAYGFSPTSPIDEDIWAKAINDGADSKEQQDLKEEMSMTRHVKDPDLQKKYKEAWEASGVTCVFQNAGAEGNNIAHLIKRFARFTYVADSMTGCLKRTVFPKDIEQVKKDGLHCLYYSANGVPLTQQWNTVKEELGFIRIFFQFGCRMMHLTYNRWNMIGVGCGEESKGGLSDFGRAVVHEMNNVGVIVDVAHSGLQTSMDAAKTSKKPMVASHSACKGLNQHCRAKTDDVMRAIFDTDGYMGVCCMPDFLGGSGDINAFLDHIDYIVKHFGAEHAAIGTDAGHRLQKSGEKPVKMPAVPGRTVFRSLWPENSFSNEYQQGNQILSMAWTNWPLFTVGLVQRGHSDENIMKILGGNVLRVARAVMPDSLPFASS